MFQQCCAEPSLDELFDDFAMQLLMRRDGVTESDVKALLCDLKDIRKAALGGINRKPLSGSHGAGNPGRGEIASRGRDADKIPIRQARVDLDKTVVKARSTGPSSRSMCA